MPSVLRRRLFTRRKPPAGSRIDWQHPLAPGLVGLWLLADRGHAPRNLVATAPASSIQGNVTWGTSPNGPSLVFPGGSGDYVSTPSYAAMRSSRLTVAVLARATNATTGILASVNYDGNSVPFALHPGPTEFALQTAFSSYTGATGWVSAAAGSDYRDGLWHLFVGTYDAAVLRLYVDGVLAGSTTQAGLVDTTNTNTLDIGRYSTDYLTGNIGWAAIWNRPLPAAAISRLYAEPYGHILAPAPHQRFWVLVSSGASVTVTPSTLALTLAALAPTPHGSATVTPSAQALTLATVAPTPTAGATSSPAAQALTLALGAPTVSTTQSVTVTPAVLALTLAALAPTPSGGAAVSVSAQALTLATNAPTPHGGATFTVSAQALTLGQLAPSVSAGGDVTISPSALALTLSPVAPTVTGAAGVTPSALVLTLAVPAPSITAGGSVTVTPAALALTLALLTPTTAAGAGVTASTLALTLSVAAMTFSGGSRATPATLALTLAVLAPFLGEARDITVTIGAGYSRWTTGTGQIRWTSGEGHE
jgi:hypothetical protein